MNSENIQQQIDERCPCFSKYLEECDCDFNEDYSGLVGSTTCPLCGSWDYEIDEMGNCSDCGNTVDPL